MSISIHHTYIERVTITGPNDDAHLKRAYAYCDKHGYHVTRSGPKRISLIKGDTSRFQLRAERELLKGDVI